MDKTIKLDLSALGEGRQVETGYYQQHRRLLEVQVRRTRQHHNFSLIKGEYQNDTTIQSTRT